MTQLKDLTFVRFKLVMLLLQKLLLSEKSRFWTRKEKNNRVNYTFLPQKKRRNASISVGNLWSRDLKSLLKFSLYLCIDRHKMNCFSPEMICFILIVFVLFTGHQLLVLWLPSLYSCSWFLRQSNLRILLVVPFWSTLYGRHPFPSIILHPIIFAVLLRSYFALF